MICNNTKELLAEIKKYMDINDIKQKDLAVAMNKDQRNVSQNFNNENPTCNTVFEMLHALNLELDINFININK